MDEIEVLESKEAAARAAVRSNLRALGRDARAATSPSGWVRERPLATLLAAGGLSAALGLGAGVWTAKLLDERRRRASPDGGGAGPARADGRLQVVSTVSVPPPARGATASRLARWATGWALRLLREAPILLAFVLRRFILNATLERSGKEPDPGASRPLVASASGARGD